VPLPWSRREPYPLLTEWAQRHHLVGEGKRAIVPGCGLGADAEYLAGRGFTATAFDVSPTAIRLARERHPGTSVEYVCADLLRPPRHGCRRSTW
jgi:2-polyprenyl-3-methyl-5-hydroxy-6-metoxy-1,4-benzoquinol methylase